MELDELAACLGQFSTATLYEAAGKTGDIGPIIRPIVPGARMAGVARTLRIWPGDTLGVLRMIDAVPARSVLVIDAGGADRAAVWGGTSALAAMARGVRGCVTNGSVRDVDEIVALGFPVFAAGISPRGTMKQHPGWAGGAISVGDCVVCEGDIVVGDTDGVVVIAGARALQVLPLAQVQAEREAERDRRVRAGESLASVLGLPS
jgi:4-hydroxy-4-methyl-2-oxoglutarate aldolase